MIQFGQSSINKQMTLDPNGFYMVQDEITENNYADENIFLFNYEATKNRIEFLSESNCSVYLMTIQQMGEFLSTQKIQSEFAWINKTSLEFSLNYSFLTTELTFSPVEFTNSEQNLIKRVQFVILIVNEIDRANQISLRFDQANLLFDFLNQFAGHLLTLGFIVVAVFLFYHAYIEKKAENKDRSVFLRNIGLGYTFAASVTLLWAVWGWNRTINPEYVWINRAYVEIPIPSFSNNILTYFSLIGLAMAIFFLSWSIESNIQARKRPIISISLLFSSGLLLIGLIWPPIIAYFIWIWIIAMIISIINITFTYLRVIIESDGVVRKKALQILLGIIIPLTCMMIRDFFVPEFLFNFIAVIFLIILCNGIK